MFRIGDIVEVIKTYGGYEDSWMGRQMTVVELMPMGMYYHLDGTPYVGPVVRTTPAIELPLRFKHAWVPEQLRKVNPPDFSIPLIREEVVNS